MPIVDSVEINRPADQVWAYVADYRNDTSWRANVRQLHPSRPGPAQVGVTTHEALRLLDGLSELAYAPDITCDGQEHEVAHPTERPRRSCPTAALATDAER